MEALKLTNIWISLSNPGIVYPHSHRSSVCVNAVPWGCNLQSLESATALQDWLAKQNLPPQKVELEKVDSGGRGLVANKKIWRGDRLLYVPSEVLITYESEWSCSEAGKLLKENGVPEWPTLASYLIYEAALGKQSRWQSYIDALPKNPSSILQWSISDVQTCLEPLPVKNRALEMIETVTNTFHGLDESIFSKHPEVFYPKVYTLETFKWAFGILFSRLVRLPSLGKLALVPWGDMINHSTEVDAFLDFDSSSKSVIILNNREYEKGEEVFVSYGKRSNAELLLSYGFIPNNLNKENTVELTVTIDEDDESRDKKLEALAVHGLSLPMRFPVQMSGIPEQLLAFARFAVSPPSQAQNFVQMAFAATDEGNKKKGRVKDDPSFSLEDQIETSEYLVSVCEQSLDQYKRFFQGKESLIDNKDIFAGKNMQDKKRHSLTILAIKLAMSERNILYRMQHILRSELLNLRAELALNSSQSQKKRMSLGALRDLKRIFL